MRVVQRLVIAVPVRPRLFFSVKVVAVFGAVVSWRNGFLAEDAVAFTKYQRLFRKFPTAII